MYSGQEDVQVRCSLSSRDEGLLYVRLASLSIGNGLCCQCLNDDVEHVDQIADRFGRRSIKRDLRPMVVDSLGPCLKFRHFHGRHRSTEKALTGPHLQRHLRPEIGDWA